MKSKAEQQRPEQPQTASVHGIPRNIDAERSVLGSILVDAKAMLMVLEFFRRGDVFYAPRHQLIFEAMLGLHAAGMPCDLITLSNKLEAAGQYETVGGTECLMELMEVVPTAANVGHYCAIVLDRYKRRELMYAGMRTIERAQEAENTDEVANTAISEIQDLQDKSSIGGRARHISESVVELAKRIEVDGCTGKRRLLETGIKALDALTGGMPLQQPVYIYARPNECKSVLALQIQLHHAMMLRQPVFYVSGETPEEELAEMVVRMAAEVDARMLRTGPISELAFDAITGSISKLIGIPFYWWDCSEPTLDGMEAEARWIMRKEGRPLISVGLDRIELLSMDGRDENDRQTKRSNGLTKLGKRLLTTMIIQGQPNQDQKRRSDPEPVLTDCGGSNAIRANAKMVIMPYRADYGQENEANPISPTVLFVRKNKGPTGRPKDVYLHRRMTRFYTTDAEARAAGQRLVQQQEFAAVQQ